MPDSSIIFSMNEKDGGCVYSAKKDGSELEKIAVTKDYFQDTVHLGLKH